MSDLNNQEELNREILTLFQYFRRFREEIARINQGEGDKGHFRNMADQLDAIVGSTERATETILENLEVIGSTADALRQQGSTETATNIDAAITAAMEACSFQDLTGQRVSKIVRSMQFVEERVNAMIELIGRDEIVEIAKSMGEEELGKELEDALLQGPALDGDGISQDEIDKLFD
jgi:chemotaxis protein CheZ